MRRWKCYGKHPKPQFSLKTGTIFEDSPLGLDKWLSAAWLLCEICNLIGVALRATDYAIRPANLNHELLAVFNVLTRDAMIGRRLLELDVLLAAKTRAFVVVAKEYTDEASGKIIIGALEKILKMLDENRFPFIARIRENGTVKPWKTEPIRLKGYKRKKAYR